MVLPRRARRTDHAPKRDAPRTGPRAIRPSWLRCLLRWCAAPLALRTCGGQLAAVVCTGAGTACGMTARHRQRGTVQMRSCSAHERLEARCWYRQRPTQHCSHGACAPSKVSRPKPLSLSHRLRASHMVPRVRRAPTPSRAGARGRGPCGIRAALIRRPSCPPTRSPSRHGRAADHQRGVGCADESSRSRDESSRSRDESSRR